MEGHPHEVIYTRAAPPAGARGPAPGGCCGGGRCGCWLGYYSECGECGGGGVLAGVLVDGGGGSAGECDELAEYWRVGRDGGCQRAEFGVRHVALWGGAGWSV